MSQDVSKIRRWTGQRSKVLDDHERQFNAGYLAALYDVAILLISRARTQLGKRGQTDDLAGPLIDAGIDVVKLQHNLPTHSTDRRLH